MTKLRKVAPEEAAAWATEPDQIEVWSLPARSKIADRTGLVRLDYPAHGSVGWSGRVYSGGREYTRFFSDARYGGSDGALRSAAAWRDEVRGRVSPPERAPRRRVLRVERPEWKNVGYFAWHAGKRRYFSDARYGGPDAARQAAEAWADNHQVE